MKSHKIKINVEGGKTLEFDLNKEEFLKMSDMLDTVLPDKGWKTETVSIIEV